MDEEKILEFAKENGYNHIEYEGEWNNYKVYALVINKDEISYVGYPLVALVTEKEIRISTREESMEVLNYFYSDNDDE